MFGLMRKSTHVEHVERTQHAVFAQTALLVQARYERDVALKRVEAALAVLAASKGTTVGVRAMENALGAPERGVSS